MAFLASPFVEIFILFMIVYKSSLLIEYNDRSLFIVSDKIVPNLPSGIPPTLLNILIKYS